ncbi:hypothetical protein AGMMS50239_26050 [Bacteroidia bacterium]|nr:hypothetical protein AGMMS50239_26050 [Bacteroidia bacterium]
MKLRQKILRFLAFTSIFIYSQTLISYKANHNPLPIPAYEVSVRVNLFSETMNYTKEQVQAADYIYQKAIQNGFNKTQALSIIGNAVGESNLNPGAVNKSSGAFGVMQWLGDRKRTLIAKYGDKPSFEQQVDHLFDELKGGKGGWNHIKGSGKYNSQANYYQPSLEEWSKSPSLEDAVYSMNRGFVRPGVHEMRDKNRISAAVELGNAIGVDTTDVYKGLSTAALSKKYMDYGGGSSSGYTLGKADKESPADVIKRLSKGNSKYYMPSSVGQALIAPSESTRVVPSPMERYMVAEQAYNESLAEQSGGNNFSPMALFNKFYNNAPL